MNSLQQHQGKNDYIHFIAKETENYHTDREGIAKTWPHFCLTLKSNHFPTELDCLLQEGPTCLEILAPAQCLVVLAIPPAVVKYLMER